MPLEQNGTKVPRMKVSVPLAATAVTALGGGLYLVQLFTVIFGMHSMFIVADVAWYVGLLAATLDFVALVITRKKRFVAFFFILILTVIGTAGYVRRGGEGAALPHPMKSH
jgi:hypothetical protein